MTPTLTAAQNLIPIGRLNSGQALSVDLSVSGGESHGVVIGATGTGKTVLVQSLLKEAGRLGSATLISTEPEEYKSLSDSGLVQMIDGGFGVDRVLQGVREFLDSMRSAYREVAEDGAYTGPGHVMVFDGAEILEWLAETHPQDYREIIADLRDIVRQGRAVGHRLIFTAQHISGKPKNILDAMKLQSTLLVAMGRPSSEQLHRLFRTPAVQEALDADKLDEAMPPGSGLVLVNGSVERFTTEHQPV